MDKYIVVSDGGPFTVAPHPAGCSYAYALHVAWSFNQAVKAAKREPRIELDSIPQDSPPKPADKPGPEGGERVPLQPVPPAPPSPISLVEPSQPVWAPIPQADIAF